MVHLASQGGMVPKEKRENLVFLEHLVFLDHLAQREKKGVPVPQVVKVMLEHLACKEKEEKKDPVETRENLALTVFLGNLAWMGSRAPKEVLVSLES